MLELKKENGENLQHKQTKNNNKKKKEKEKDGFFVLLDPLKA